MIAVYNTWKLIIVFITEYLIGKLSISRIYLSDTICEALSHQTPALPHH